MDNKNKTNEFKRLNIRVSSEMHEFLREMSDSRGLTMNAVVIFALENYFNQQHVIPQLEELIAESKRIDGVTK